MQKFEDTLTYAGVAAAIFGIGWGVKYLYGHAKRNKKSAVAQAVDDNNAREVINSIDRHVDEEEHRLAAGKKLRRLELADKKDAAKHSKRMEKYAGTQAV